MARMYNQKKWNPYLWNPVTGLSAWVTSINTSSIRGIRDERVIGFLGELLDSGLGLQQQAFVFLIAQGVHL